MCITLLEVRDSSYLGLLSIFGSRKEGFSLRACLVKKNWIFRLCSMFLLLGEPQFA